jgi:hypothetical protein
MNDEASANSMMDCLVTKEDFACAIQDVHESSGARDWELTDDEVAEQESKQTKDEKGDSSS